MSSRPVLTLDWCSHKAAEYACKRWHYSKSVPAGKTTKVGVWEDEQFVGCVIFSRGATTNIGRPYKLPQTEVCELTRIALTRHKTPVSRIMSIAIRMLKNLSPGLRLIVSYADMDQNHHGGIYQATNWVYTGLVNENSVGAIYLHGKKTHTRSVSSRYGTASIPLLKKHVDPNLKLHRTRGKHKYLMPLDDAMRRQVASLSKNYPKRV